MTDDDNSKVILIYIVRMRSRLQMTSHDELRSLAPPHKRDLPCTISPSSSNRVSDLGPHLTWRGQVGQHVRAARDENAIPINPFTAGVYVATMMATVYVLKQKVCESQLQ